MHGAAIFPLEEIHVNEFEPAVRDQISGAYRQAEQGSFDATTTGKLGMILQVYGRYELAQTCYLRARELEPLSFRWAYYLGNVQGLLGRHREAVETLRAALKLDPGYTPALARLAQLHLAAGDTRESLRTFRQAVEADPGLATAHFGLGQALAASENWLAARQSYQRACEISDGYTAAHYALAMAYRRTGDVANAQAHLLRYQQLKQTKQPAFDRLTDEIDALYAGGQSHMADATLLLQRSKLREAAAEFEAALRVNPKLVVAHINLIAVSGQLGLASQAEQHYRASIAMDPGWVEAYYNWGMFLLQGGKEKAEAARMFEKAIEVNPNYADAHVQLGTLLDESGRSADATAHYRRALEVSADHRQAHFLLGHNLAGAGQFAEAIEHLTKTIAIEDSKTPVCMRALALAYERAGNRKQSLHYARQARQRAASLGMPDLVAQLDAELTRMANESGPR